MSGKAAECKPRGLLRIAKPQRLVVSANYRGAFRPDGQPLRKTQRLWGLGYGECPDPHPDSIAVPQHLSEVHEDVVWGGFLTYHFGHFLSESIARLWPVLPGGPLDGFPVVFATPSRQAFIREWETGFALKTVELPAADLVAFSRMHVPDPAWRMDAWIAPEIRDIHLHARAGLDVPVRRGSEILWLSRGQVTPDRRVADELLCQWLLGDRIKVLNPQELSLVEQLAEIESSQALVGPIGSAFHTLLLSHRMPDAYLLCPSTVSASFVAQDWLLKGDATFIHALANDRLGLEKQDRHPYRLLIPETLRALNASLLPGLLDDEFLHRLAYPEERVHRTYRKPPRGQDIHDRVARALLDPNRIQARMDLGSCFEEEGFFECAAEQFSIVADLASDYTYAALRAARALHRLDRPHEAARYARTVLAVDSTSDEAQHYVALGKPTQA